MAATRRFAKRIGRGIPVDNVLFAEATMGNGPGRIGEHCSRTQKANAQNRCWATRARRMRVDPTYSCPCLASIAHLTGRSRSVSITVAFMIQQPAASCGRAVATAMDMATSASIVGRCMRTGQPGRRCTAPSRQACPSATDATYRHASIPSTCFSERRKKIWPTGPRSFARTSRTA